MPLDRLAEAIEETLAIGRRHGLDACSWGHAGDGNLHSTFLRRTRRSRASSTAPRGAADDLFALAVRLGGIVSGEHGLGLVRSGWLGASGRRERPRSHGEIKRVFDPKGLLNPGKKVA